MDRRQRQMCRRDRRREAWIDAVAHKIEAAVEEGDLDEATAHKKWRHFLDEQVGPKLKAAIAAGMLDEEEALEFWEELSEEEDDEDHKNATADKDAESRFKAWVGRVGGELKEAVAAGKLDEETARKKWQHFTEQELAPKLKSAVQSGQVDEEFALSLWKALKKAEGREKGGSTEQEIDWERAKSRIEGAVKAGKLTREQALALFTSAAAYAAFQEDDLGTIEAGKLADFTVFDIDLMTVPEAEILDAKTVMTVVGGKIVYDASTAEAE